MGGEIAVCRCAIKHTPQRDKPSLISSPAIFQLHEGTAREVGERRRRDYKDIWTLRLKEKNKLRLPAWGDSMDERVKQREFYGPVHTRTVYTQLA